MRSIQLAVIMLVAVTARLEALPKGLQWGMSQEEAKTLLGGTVKKEVQTRKVHDIYFTGTEYVGLPFEFHLAFEDKAGLTYLDANIGTSQDGDEKALREEFEKVALQLSKDVPGVGTKYEEKKKETFPFILETLVKTDSIRFCHAIHKYERQTGHRMVKGTGHLITIKKLKSAPSSK
jgi:hypothetical protein